MEGYGIDMSVNISQTVIIPTRNEENYIENCINSLVDDWVISTTEFLIVDGSSTDKTLEIVKEKFSHLNLKILDNPNLYQSYAMNIGIENSSAKDTVEEFETQGSSLDFGKIIRADAHCIYPPNYIKDCRQYLRRFGYVDNHDGGVVNMGSIQKAVGLDTFTKAVATVMNSKYAMGGVKYRRSYDENTEPVLSDTAYLGCWQTGLLIEIGGFDEEFQINEDYELNIRIRKKYGLDTVAVNPKLVVNYFVRNSLFGLIKQFFKYGLWKTKTLSIHPDSLKIRQLAPVLFVLSLVSLGIGYSILPFYGVLNWITGIVGLLWLILILSIWKDSPKISNILIIPIVVFLMHISWGVGFLFGLLRWARGGWNKS